MHGFLNLSCAAAVLYFGGELADAKKVLAEEDSSAWQLGAEGIEWRHLNGARIKFAILRREFFISIGSCSFEEPIEELRGAGMAMKSWVERANHAGLRFSSGEPAVRRVSSRRRTRIGVAIGDQILDLRACMQREPSRR